VPQNNKHWPYPGKVLIVDDEYDESIDLAVKQLLQNGVRVDYWNGSDNKANLSNVRIVLLDLILRKDDADRPAPEKFYKAIEALSQIRGASIVIIFSNTADEPNEFESAYTRKQGRKYPGIISSEKMEKGKLEDHKQLISLIEGSVKKYPELRLALVVESIVDSAKDGAFQHTLGQNVDVVATLIRILERQTGFEGLRKDLVDTMIRIISRYAHSGEAYEVLSDVLKVILEKAPARLAEADGSLLSLLMYYQPKEEQVWTGDIFQTPKEDGRDIAIVLTPACDLAWNKRDFVTIALGFSLTDPVCKDREGVLFRKDSNLRDWAVKEKGPVDAGSREDILNRINGRIKRYRVTGEDLPSWAYLLRHVNNGKDLVDVCLDLGDIETVALEELTKKGSQWTRITRLDSPFIEALLQHFGEHLSRIGVPDVNLPLKVFAERAN